MLATAGLLTRPGSAAFPPGGSDILAKLFRGSQQRVLSGIFTRFPVQYRMANLSLEIIWTMIEIERNTVGSGKIRRSG